MRNYKYTLSLLPACFVIAGNLAGGWYVALNAVFSLGILALLENIVPEDKSNDADEGQLFPDALLYAHVLFQILCMYSLLYAVKHHELNAVQYVLMILSTGINSGGSAIVIAHELIHRKNKWHRRAGKLLLFTAGNIYFYVNHLIIHHKWVGTARDPATARFGESVYRFFARTTLEQIITSYQAEAQRLKGKNAIEFVLRNYVTASVLLMITTFVLLYWCFGGWAAFAWVLQCKAANFLLEYTNYIEHYGLTRKENERVNEIHSWQSDKVISRFFLIDLSRHSDHHYYASKPYHRLISYAGSPVLPGGYVSMIYYALIPPLWFKTMNPLVHHAMKKPEQE
jgi:alkane 1-monooxygenase